MDWIRVGTAGVAAALLGTLMPPVSAPRSETAVSEARSGESAPRLPGPEHAPAREPGPGVAPEAVPEPRTQSDRADWLSVLARVRSSDLREQREALASLRRLHRHLLARVTRDASLDEDALFSDFLLKLEQSYRRHLDPDRPAARIRSVYALAHSIVRSTLADAFGRAAASPGPAVSIDDLGDLEPAVDAPDDYDLARAIEALPDEHRDALQATLESGSVRAAADRLGLRPPQVRYRFDEARRSLARAAGLG